MINVLVVDDNHDILDLFLNLYEGDRDISIYVASSGKEAEGLLKKNHSQFDVILSDYEMPHGDGNYLYEVNLKYKKPFIFHSSSLDYNLKNVQISESVKTFYFEKPADIDKITECIFRAVNKINKSDVYYPISNVLTVRYMKLVSDLFIIIDDSYIKISSKSSQNIDLVKRHISKGSFSCFYIKNEDIKKIITATVEKRNDLDFLSDYLEVLQATFMQMQESREELEIACHDLYQVFTSKEKEYQKVLASSVKAGNFCLSHSIVSTYISFIVLNKLRLNTEKTCSTFLYAYLVHDVDLHLSDLETQKKNFIIKEKKDMSFEKNFKVRSLLERHHILKGTEFTRLPIEQKIFNFSHLASLYFLNSESIADFNLRTFLDGNSELTECQTFINNIVNSGN